jgi:hypothetical protein
LTQLSNWLAGVAALECKGLISYSALAQRRTRDGTEVDRKTNTMRISYAGIVVTICCSLSAAAHAEQLRTGSTATTQNPVPTPVAASPAAPPVAPPPSPFVTSEILQPSLDTVQQTLGQVKIDKWKKGSIRDEAGSDIDQIQRDLQDNLPPMLKDADASQGSLSKVLPVSKHVDALYDVLLRVVEAARFSAPDDQATQLRQALSGLGNARLKLDDRIQERAAAQETQIHDLRGTVEKQASFKCPAPPPTPVCTTPPPKKPRKKTTSSTSTTKTQTNAPANNPSNPNNSAPASSTVAPKNGPN